ncbi:MAG: hypothetical protein F6K42_18865 [Leptolyngbya sp. SIO1D8]|nr:hypothetical protein [Leptolyngbya sp. SIO1D8]
MPRRKRQQPLATSQITRVLSNPKKRATIRARCQAFGPQSALSLARSLGFNVSRPHRGGYVVDSKFIQAFERQLERRADLGLEKVPSRDNPQKFAYRIAQGVSA